MPFSPATITTVIDRTKRLEICDTLHDAQQATTEDEFIKAGQPLIVFTYQSGIVDDALLASDFTEATLNTNNIFTTGSFTPAIVDAFFEVYIMRDASVTINLTGFQNCKISVMGGGNLILVAGNTSYATVKAYDNATVNITINDDAMVDFETKDSSVSNVVINNNGVFQLITHSKSIVTARANGNSYGRAKTYHQSTLTYIYTPPALFDVEQYAPSQVILT